MSKKRRMSPKQKQAKIDAAKKSVEAAQKSKDRSTRRKKVLTIVVCVVLILGLCIPTMSLTVCNAVNKSQTEESK